MMYTQQATLLHHMVATGPGNPGNPGILPFVLESPEIFQMSWICPGISP